MSKLWYPQPIYAMLLEILMKKRGNCIDVEVYDALQEQFPDLSFLTLNKTLMDLELEGLIHVFTLTTNKRRVELSSQFDEQSSIS